MTRRTAIACTAALALATGCSALGGGARGPRDVRFGNKSDHKGPALTEEELQQDLQRFTGEFSDRIVDAAAPLAKADDPKIREAALRQSLLYASSALDIVTGPLPETGLLDMVVFVSLARGSLEQYWVPKVFGELGSPMVDAFAASERDIWVIAGKLMTAAQEQQLRELIRVWREENPDQIRVEGVRFGDFATRAGKVEAERAQSVSGLFGSMNAAVHAADRAVLLGNRAMFLVNRFPFLVRMQTRLGAQEMTDDALKRMQGLGALLERNPDAQPLVQELSSLVEKSEAAVRETRLLVDKLDPWMEYATKPHVPGAGAGSDTSLDRTLDVSNHLLDKTLTVVDRSNGLADRTQVLLDRTGKLATDGKQYVALASKQFDATLRRLLVYLIILGAAWSLFFWGGYYLFKRYSAARPAPVPRASLDYARSEARSTHMQHSLPRPMASTMPPHARRRARRTLSQRPPRG